MHTIIKKRKIITYLTNHIVAFLNDLLECCSLSQGQDLLNRHGRLRGLMSERPGLDRIAIERR